MKMEEEDAFLVDVNAKTQTFNCDQNWERKANLSLYLWNDEYIVKHQLQQKYCE